MDAARESGQAKQRLILAAALLTLGLVMLATAVSVYAIFTASTSVTSNDFASDTLDPATLLGATGGASVDLSWTATADTYAGGHRVLRSTTSGGPYTQIAGVTPRTTTTYTDNPAAGTYYYVVRAFYQNWESVNGNEASASVSGISFRAAASAAAPSGTLSLTINRPSGTSVGDVMIASIAVRPNTATITEPAGWTLVRRIDNANANANSLAVYYKVAGGSEPANYTWTFSTSTGSAGGIQTFSGVDTTNPINVEAGQNTANGLTHATPSVTTTAANTMIVTSHGFTSSATWTPPAGMTEAFDAASLTVPATGGISIEGNYAIQTAAGATGTKTATASNNSDVGNTHILALNNPPGVSLANAWTTGLTHAVSAGSNRLLVFIAGMENGLAGGSPPAGDRDLTAVTYGGQSLTPAAEVVVCSGSPNSFCARTELWYLDEAGIQAATGSTFSPTWSGDPPFELEEHYTAVTLENVDQSSPIGNSSTNGTTTANPIQTSSALVVGAGDLVVVSAFSGAAGSYTPGSGYTEGTDQSALSSTMASAYKAIAAGGTEQPSMQYDLTINRQVILAAVINMAP